MFGVTRVIYLGHIIEDRGVMPLSKNIEGIKNMRSPKDEKELQSFMGMINFYHRFIEAFAEIAAPLYDLLKDNTFRWLEIQERSFNKLKDNICRKPILLCFDNDLEVILSVDASARGVREALLQILDKEERPVIYFSRRFRPVEEHYSVIEN
ncbi:uncharacterized protein LOC135922126 [Gordionus sp. m RMFG-2023]|uniref:uncharacterized protein LOC135922126 n=1 Tax=Gordionus sp. m RMFG-2023 TaxID=3053472 RepID=UPI0031FC1F9C